MDQKGRLVYSTDGGWHAPQAGAKRSPQGRPAAPPDDGTIRVARERRRAGVVTAVTGLPAKDAETLGKELKRLCGAGGTVKDGRLEIQGDHRDRIVAFFEARGLRVKRVGG